MLLFYFTALWKRLYAATDNQILIGPHLKQIIWTFLKFCEHFEFYELSEARAKLVIYDQFHVSEVGCKQEVRKHYLLL